MGTGSFPGVKCGRGVLLTTHPLLLPRSWKSRTILLPTLWTPPGSLYLFLFYLLPGFILPLFRSVYRQDVVLNVLFRKVLLSRCFFKTLTFYPEESKGLDLKHFWCSTIYVEQTGVKRKMACTRYEGFLVFMSGVCVCFQPLYFPFISVALSQFWFLAVFTRCHTTEWAVKLLLTKCSCTSNKFLIMYAKICENED